MSKFKGVLVKVFGVALLGLTLSGESVYAAGNSSLSGVVNNWDYNYFATTKRGDNVVYSAYSITELMALASNGDSEKTYQTKLGSTAVNKQFKGYTNDLLKNANLVMVRGSSKSLNSSFRKKIVKYYDADVKSFTDIVKGKVAINKYVKKKTDGFIVDYSPILNDNSELSLINCLYFKGDWKYPFTAEKTGLSKFTNYSGDVVDVNFMNQTIKGLGYYSNSKFSCVSMPYKDSDTAMYIVMANDSNNIQRLWGKLKNGSKESFLKKVKSSDKFVKLSIPKFKLDCSYDLSQYAYGTYDKILNNSTLTIDAIQHRAKLKIDELGTEAAAVTEMTMKNGIFIAQDDIIEFNCNKPFVVIIRDTKQNINLFTGVVNKLNN